MGTRGLIRLCDAKGNVYAAVYTQYDSYPGALGAKLQGFLSGFTISNGFEFAAPILLSIRKYNDLLAYVEQDWNLLPDTRQKLISDLQVAQQHLESNAMLLNAHRSSSKQANGIECLYAQLIAHLKVTIGSVYLHLPGEDISGSMIEYVYEIRPNDAEDQLTVKVGDSDSMDLVSFGDYCKSASADK